MPAITHQDGSCAICHTSLAGRRGGAITCGPTHKKAWQRLQAKPVRDAARAIVLAEREAARPAIIEYQQEQRRAMSTGFDGREEGHISDVGRRVPTGTAARVAARRAELFPDEDTPSVLFDAMSEQWCRDQISRGQTL